MDMITLAMAKSYTNSQRLGYTETVDFMIVEKTKFDFAPELGVGDLYAVEIESVNRDKITAGLQLVVHYDGEDYICTVMEVSGVFAFGNLGVLGIGPDTGEPFLITDNGDRLGVIAADTAETHTIGIICDTETVHTIDPKFIPGAVLPVVKLTTVVTAEGAELTVEEAAKMDALSGNPAVLKANVEGVGEICGVINAMVVGGQQSYMVGFGTLYVILQNSDGAWTALHTA